MERKKKVCKECSNLDYIFSKGRCKRCASKEYSRNMKINKDKKNKVSGGSAKSFLMPLISEAPNNCQCCNESIVYFKQTNNPLICAHILEKRNENFLIVANNKKNIVFLCDGCHNGFDNIGADWFKKQSESFQKLIKDRVKYLSNFLTEKQEVRIKDYLKN